MTAGDCWQPGFLNSSPLFAPLRVHAQSLDAHNDWPDLATLNALLAARAVHNRNDQPVQCVAPSTRATRWQDRYEPRLYFEGALQTRARNWHDLFNALVWANFPQTKAALNALHYRYAQTQAAGANRTRAQDVLTLFDEGGIIVASDRADLLEHIRAFRWKTLFWQERATVAAHVRFFLFGHALYEKALAPHVGLTAKGLLLSVEPAFFSAKPTTQLAHVDAQAAVALAQPAILASTRALAPVPFLGYPGWSADNAVESYYDNSDYFRAGWYRVGECAR